MHRNSAQRPYGIIPPLATQCRNPPRVRPAFLKGVCLFVQIMLPGGRFALHCAMRLSGFAQEYVSLQMSDTPYIYIVMRTRDSTTNAFPYSRHTFQLMVAIYIHLSWHRLMPRMVPIPSTASTHHHIRPYFKPRKQFDCQFLGHSKRKD